MQTKAPIHGTLTAPKRANKIPSSSQWLSGEGAGSWFYIVAMDKNFKITRYSPRGKIECSGLFNIINEKPFNINEKYEFVYLSHCESVTLKQHEKIIIMKRIK